MFDHTRDEADAFLEQRDRVDGVVLGEIADIEDGQILVTHALGSSPEPQPARSISWSGALSVGDRVALVFENGDIALPLIFGKLHDQTAQVNQVKSDPEQRVIEHPQKVVLKAGDASITLSHDGKVELKGDYIVSTSKGVNRVAGASVKIN
ncbi:MAG: DUF6484 domain-containing protein [Pseudomonadota bacterium]